MKKVLVILTILVAAAACGGGGGAGSTSGGGSSLSYAPAQQNAQSGAPSKSNGSTDAANPTVNSAVPAIQGPQVIRQAQLTISVGAGRSAPSVWPPVTMREFAGTTRRAASNCSAPATKPRINPTFCGDSRRNSFRGAISLSASSPRKKSAP